MNQRERDDGKEIVGEGQRGLVVSPWKQHEIAQSFHSYQPDLIVIFVILVTHPPLYQINIITHLSACFRGPLSFVNVSESTFHLCNTVEN